MCASAEITLFRQELICIFIFAQFGATQPGF